MFYYQVVLSLPSQQQLLSASGGGNGQLVTYLQPLGSIGVPVSNMDQNHVIMAASDLQGNVTLHNVSSLNGSKRNGIEYWFLLVSLFLLIKNLFLIIMYMFYLSVLSTNRQQSQVNLSTPRRRLSTDPRSCEQCGRTFKYPSDLKKHLQIHTGKKVLDQNLSFARIIGKNEKIYLKKCF